MYNTEKEKSYVISERDERESWGWGGGGERVDRENERDERDGPFSVSCLLATVLQMYVAYTIHTCNIIVLSVVEVEVFFQASPYWM